MKTKVNLANLPNHHDLRNKPLKEIGAKARNTFSTAAFERPVAKWKIGPKTFNELGKVWIRDTVFFVELTDEELKQHGITI